METGGFMVGRNRWLCITASWGFGVLEISPERLVLDTTWRRYIFRHDSIVRLSTKGLLLTPGIRIEHSVAAYARYLAFTTYKVARVVRHLRDAGYHVEEASGR